MKMVNLHVASSYYCEGFYDHSAASISPATPSGIFKTPTPKKKQSASNAKVDAEKSKEEEIKSQKKRKSEDENEEVITRFLHLLFH